MNDINGHKEMSDLFVVGVGASAGGLEALEQFFKSMPVTENLAFIVIQHLSPDFKSLMPEILSRHIAMKVCQIQDGMEIQPGCIYLNPPKYTVTISDGRLLTAEQDPIHKVNLSINIFLESLAQDKGDKSVAIILSGTGSDGARGCRAIKEAGGIVFAQEPISAKFNGMPKSVIATNVCDFVLSPEKMPEKLLKYANQAPLIPLASDDQEKTDGSMDALTKIFSILKSRYLVDFGLYKQSTVFRCLDRRIRICQMPTVEDYLSYMENNANEVDRLYNSLLIGVTRFFRDADAFEIIKEKVIPEIVAGKPADATIRVWAAGCSTGEEVYSLAMLFKEYMDASHKNVNVKIFATDIDPKAIEYASAGIYPESTIEDVSLDRLNRFFIKKRDGYHVTKYIREMVIFSRQNVINNPPFNKIDLLVCRNLLIYFQNKLQKRILSTFQFALEANGFLFLGTSETTGELSRYFDTYNAKWKIFRRKNIKKRPLIDDFSVISAGMDMGSQRDTEEYSSVIERSKWEMEEIYAYLIEECLPPSVLVDEKGELVHVCGQVDRYLKVPRGRVVYDIRKMVPKELSVAIGTAVNKAIKDKKQVTYSNLKATLDQGQTSINLIVRPIYTKKSGGLILIIFEEAKMSTKGDAIENFDTVSELHTRISDLEQELQYTKESLQTSLEEIETSSEELQSANEELLVSNEELHSTNEELQSVNEELMVVNTQYQYKIQELADLNNDMTNFLNSTTIGTIFLDPHLCVRKFTPSITKEVNLMDQDIGRPISHISHNLKDENLVKESLTVLDSLVPIEKEVLSTNGKWYILKYSPFRTNENAIKGVVISLVDITMRKVAQERERKSLGQLNEAIALDALKSDFFSNLSHELRTPLNVIMSTLQLMESQNRKSGVHGNEGHSKHYSIMKQNCYRLLRLINNMIDSTKMDSGFFELKLQNHNIVKVIRGIVLSVSDYTRNKGIELVFEADVEEKITACDLDGVERILLNLLSNAIKFTKEGGRIKVEVRDKGEAILLSVKDSGIGIPEDKLNIIFDRFRQVEKTLTRNFEGSGIGLSIVKSLVEMHGGRISVKSEYGYGTEFIIEVPVMTVPDEDMNKKGEFIRQSNVEKISIEFADIYSL